MTHCAARALLGFYHKDCALVLFTAHLYQCCMIATSCLRVIVAYAKTPQSYLQYCGTLIQTHMAYCILHTELVFNSLADDIP
jgi:hypothetical protein